MSRRSFNTRECIAKFNNLKLGYQMSNASLSKEDLLKMFKSCGLPVNGNFWSAFVNSGVVQVVSRGKYMFTSKEPLYIERLENIKRKYLELSKKYLAKKAEEVVAVEVVRDPIEDAIELLQSKGYQIFAPVGVLYKKL